MRRTVAFITLLALAHLTGARVGMACDDHVAASVASSSPTQAMHDHQGMTSTRDAGLHESSGEHGSMTCVTMVHCATAPAMTAAQVQLVGATTPSRVLAVSESTPRSVRSAPDLPPPRA